MMLSRNKAGNRNGDKNGVDRVNTLDCSVKKIKRKRKAAVRLRAKDLTTPPLVRACCVPQYSTTSAVTLPPQSLFTKKGELCERNVPLTS